ncbi:MAG: DUF499 domain-containing protein, partial [Actinomycetota bacterium]|nr:DUF499 domain-containing protein [Actinomycetota bacterium]
GTAGERTYTMWGDIAAQLGNFDVMRKNDEERSAPGSSTWRDVIGDRPTVVIIDEIAAHLRLLSSSGSEDVRRQAEAMPAFLKALFDFASANPHVVVIVTLATRSDAYGKETSDIEEMLSEAEGAFQRSMSETRSVLARSESIIRPAEDSEIAQILKTRLFERIDESAAGEAGNAYRDFYQDLAAKGVVLPGGADQPVSYGELVARSYPFHPELVRVLDQRLGTIPTFQRTRGALKLLAELIAGTWEGERETEILNAADVSLGVESVLTHLTDGLGRDEYKAVAEADIRGDSSHAGYLDEERFAGRKPFTTRAATTVFLHSLEQISSSGAGRGEYLLGTLQVDDDPTFVDEALAHLSERAWYLDYDGARYRFRTEPNANAIVAEEARNIQNSQVNAELEECIAKAFPDDGPVKTILRPTGPVDVPDLARLQLVVIHHDDASVSSRRPLPAPERVIEIRDRTGGANNFRTNRNGVVFLVADADHIAGMKDRVRYAMATERIAGDAHRLADFTPSVAEKLRQLRDQGKLQRTVAIARCYAHLYFPWADASNFHLRHYEMPPKEKGAVPDKLTKTVIEALRDEGKLRESKVAVDYLKAKGWKPDDAAEISVATIDSYFWRDHSASLVLDPNLRKETIRDGVANGTWVYFDPDTQKAWGAGDPPPPVVLDGSAILYTPERATELGITRQPLKVDDIVAVVSDEMSASELRVSLEERLGYEPSKKDVQKVLARAASGPAAQVVVVVGEPIEGQRVASEAQIERSFDPLVVLTTAKADEIGIERGSSSSRPRPVEATGTAGVAMTSIHDQVADRPNAAGIALLQVTAKADAGAGVKNLRALGFVTGRLPRFEITVDIELALEFAGLDGGARFKARASMSDYQRIEGALLALGDKASDSHGTMQLTLRPPAPMRSDSTDFEAVKKALIDVDPGEIVVRGELA